MSLDAWGDEGGVPTTWEDTAMKQEWNRVTSAFRKWRNRYEREFPNADFDTVCRMIESHMDDLDDAMSGDL